MKKFGYVFVGLVAGVALSLSVSAAADSISLIGKKVAGESDVLLDGKKIDTAVIIDGRSYAPVRSISESVGYDVGFKDKKVMLETPKKEEPVVGDTNQSETEKRIDEIKLKQRQNATRHLELTNESLSSNLTDARKSEIEIELKAIKKEAEDLRNELATLESK